jgi:hypothetical protein
MSKLAHHQVCRLLLFLAVRNTTTVLKVSLSLGDAVNIYFLDDSQVTFHSDVPRPGTAPYPAATAECR